MKKLFLGVFLSTTFGLCAQGNLTITGGSLTVSSESNITVPGNYSNIGGDLNLNSGSSIIVSGFSSGDITYIRTIPTSDWYLISSPNDGQDIDSFVTSTNLASGTGANMGLASYNNTNFQWDYYISGTAGSGSFAAGDGRAIKLAAAGDISFQGTIDASDSGVDVAITDNLNGFNLIGNPYPSYIPANISADGINNILDINTANLSEKTLWFWDASTDSYDQINHTSSALFIAPAQGFFVSSSGNTIFSFEENMQSHQPTDTFQREATSTRPEINLLMTNGTDTRDTDIFYIDGTTTGWDNGYDSTIFGGTPNEFMIYTHLVSGGEGESLGIQSLPDSSFEDMVIPIGVTAVSGTEIVISATGINFPAGINLYLEDKDQESFTLLDASSTYTTTLENDENGIGRFYLHTNTSTLSTDTPSILNHLSVYPSSRENLRIVGVQNGTAAIQMYTILGKEVLRTTFEGQGMNDIALPILSSGIYIIELVTETGTINQKIRID